MRQVIEAEATKTVLRTAGLQEFGDVKHALTWMIVNDPTIWITPLDTGFADEGSAIGQEHAVRIVIGLLGDEPEELLGRAIEYVKAVDSVLRGEAFGVDQTSVLRVFISGHNYASVFEKQGALAAFPELRLRVEIEEVE